MADMQLPVYLDYNATTPCDPRVVEAMLPYFTVKFGNAASRNHSYGWQAEEAVEKAREQVAALIGAETREVVFTSGATEAVNLAIKGAFEAYRSKGDHIITTGIEHKAVLDTCRHLEKMGASVSMVSVNEEGTINLEELEKAITSRTILIAVMYANNETGVIQPVSEIGRLARKHEVLFFTDATQAVGKIPLNVNTDQIDLLACSSHKIYGPKGVGALYVRRKNPRVRLIAQMDGGGHERGFRSGTMNVPGIVGFGKAAELCRQEMMHDGHRLQQWRDHLEKELLMLDQVKRNGNADQRLPQVSNLSFRFVESEALLMGLNKDLALATGSACTSASIEPSHVLKAMGLSDEMAYSSLRISLGRFTKEEEIEFAIDKIRQSVEKVRSISPVWEMFKAGVL